MRMITTGKTVICGLILSVLLGCENQSRLHDQQFLEAARLRDNAIQESNRLRNFEIRVESDPPGAMIEVDNDAQGRAPCIVKVEGRGDHRTTQPLGHLVTIQATPNQPGESVQRKFIMPGDKIPEHVFFNMYLSRKIPTIARG